jgi:CO/xanthine dehydrogenase Mo-binding subunit
MRSPAKPQVVFAVESHMDVIARELEMDPLEFRLKNVLKEGDSSPVGHVWQQVRAEDTLKRAAEAAGWSRPKAADSGTKAGTLTGRGMAITDLAQGVGQFAAKVSIAADGRPRLHMALWDTGTGSHTVLRQMVAEVLTVPVDEVDIELLDTASMPFSSGSGGTRVTYTAGQAVVGAARELRRRLIRTAAPLLDSPEEDVSLQSGRLVVGPSPLRPAYYRTISIGEAVAHADGESLVAEYDVASEPPDITSFCTQVAEVEVDPETGQVTVGRIVTAHDVGTVLNPLLHQGQVEGGVIQGLGYALMEELQTEDGHISTLSFGDYKIPTSNDIPELVTVLVEGQSGPAPYASKGIGESSNIPVAGAIANAVADATGARITSLPLTAEKVLAAIRARESGG